MESMYETISSAMAYARDAYNDTYLRQVGIILRREITIGEDGSAAENHVALPGSVKCRVLRGDMGAEVDMGEQIVSVRTVEIRFAYGTKINSTDRLQVGAQTFAVVSLDNERADALFLSATCTRVP